VSKPETFEIRAAPNGKRSGLAVFSDGTFHLSVAVLPKPWAGKPTPNSSGDFPSLEAKWDDGRLSITLHENERALVCCTKDQADFLSNVRNKIDRLPSADEDDPFGAERLLKLKAGDAKADTIDAPLCELTGIIDLLQLVSLARSRGGTPARATMGDGAGSEVVSVETDAKGARELLLLSQWSLVQEVKKHVREIRRGYVPRIETLGVVRGRITDRGLVQHAATGLPILECNFDQFTESTPLARVLVTALEVIVSGALLHDMRVGSWSVADELVAEAARLRRYLGSIPSLPRPVAAESASRIRLTRLQQNWARSLALTRQILNREPPKMQSQQTGAMDALVWWVNTDNLWEEILEQGLRTVADNLEVKSKGEGLLVWEGIGDRKSPDFVAEIGGKRWVLDAKYKPQTQPEAPDQYQIFAYSHLAKISGQPVNAAALLFPGTAPAHPQKTYSRYPIEPETDGLSLHLMHLPFPHREELPKWSEYVYRLSAAFKDRLKEPDRLDDTPKGFKNPPREPLSAIQ
jgi:hypothetical protein